jgi:hypothetical protein
MKRIKLFEKFVGEDKLKKFCDENLAYLIDAGYKVDIRDDDEKDKEFEDIKNISIFKSSGRYSQSQSFDLSDIKYDLIPFLIELDSKWLLRPFSDKESDEKVHIAYTYNIKDFNPKDDDYVSISELDNLENGSVNYIEVLVIGMK